MKYLVKISLSVVLAAFMFMNSGNAQKFGHINSQQLLVDSPLVKDADSKLKVFQDDLIGKGQAMVKAFEEDYTAYVKEVDAGGLSKVQMAQREEELSKSQAAIQKYEVEVQQKIAQKREELYKPILDKARVAIEQIGAEGNYTMIFDTGTSALLFALETEDLLPKVKAKLGW